MVVDTEAITKWIVETFGVPTQERVMDRVCEEFDEMIEAHNDNQSREKILEECADVAIVLCHVCHVLGGDLGEQINRKMEINRKRKWRVGADGCGYHIKE